MPTRAAFAEGGYEQFSLTVQVVAPGVVPFAELSSPVASSLVSGTSHRVESFRAIQPVDPLSPTQQYVACYEQAMREHDLPGEYCSFILDQVRVLWRTDQ